jgi:hypothetical protein
VPGEGGSTSGPAEAEYGTFALGAPVMVARPTPMLPVLGVPTVLPGRRFVALPAAGASVPEPLLDSVEEPNDGLVPLLSDPPGASAGLVRLPSGPDVAVPPVPALPAPAPGEPAPLDGA